LTREQDEPALARGAVFQRSHALLTEGITVLGPWNDDDGVIGSGPAHSRSARESAREQSQLVIRVQLIEGRLRTG